MASATLEVAKHPGRIRERQSGFLLALPAMLWLGLFFVLPLLIVLGISLLTRGTHGVQYAFPATLQNYVDVLSYPYIDVFWSSIGIAALTTLICLVIGYPLAFFIATRRSKLMQNLTLFLVILPFWTNFLVRTYAIKVMLGADGPINATLLNLHQVQPLPSVVIGIVVFLIAIYVAFKFIGTDKGRVPVLVLGAVLAVAAGLGFYWLTSRVLDSITEPITFINTQFAVLLGLTYSYLPFMVLPIYASVERFEFRLVEAAQDLGANDIRAFLRIVLPLTLPGVIAGAILVLIPTVSAFITPDILGGTEGLMIGNLITNQFRGSGNWPRGSAASIIMMALVMLALIGYVIFSARGAALNRRRPVE